MFISYRYSPDNATITRREAARSFARVFAPLGTVSDTKVVRDVASKKSRVRSNSLSLATQPARKRTSSGVFKVDDFEPPPKKIELTNTKPTEDTSVGISKSNGRTKNTESKEVSDNRTDKDKVMERFDSDSKVKCVTTFKESYDWD
uniref:Poly(A)-specific ribonuclease PARN-like protein n=1 Tax=Heliconius erato TaxID=33431 RepID=A0A142LSZ1_HELEA|nr:poly(A)-specific ribonuclease PARN-like protein [Heliconius erato]